MVRGRGESKGIVKEWLLKLEKKVEVIFFKLRESIFLRNGEWLIALDGIVKLSGVRVEKNWSNVIIRSLLGIFFRVLFKGRCECRRLILLRVWRKFLYFKIFL